MTKNILLWVVIGVILMSVFSNFTPTVGPKEMSYSDFVQSVERGSISEVKIEGRVISGNTLEGKHFTTYSPETDNRALIGILLDNTVKIVGEPPKQQSLLVQLFISSFPILLIVGIWIYFMRQMQGGGGGRGAMSFGKSKARLLGEDQVKVNFSDVAGCDEAKEEVSELVDFLKDPGKFTKLGGKIPRGVLMVGSPGTGKTLLAKAIAGEAKVPFFTISGSDFVEMFVGVGASRVRDMFEQAKKHSPCIIFIDEIDAVGRHRGAGLGGGHDEREQTLNQLLVEMDGFEGNEGVIVIAATNRPDVLDPALLRPGRFDRQVVVPLPDIKGREHILKVHLRKVPIDDNVQPKYIARGTPGFSGADLANLVNEAALFAAKEDSRVVTMEHLEKAKDKIMMGSERKSMVMKEKEKKMTAYHEAGHAIVGLLVPSHDPVYKVSIIPRGRALGVTMFLPEEDRYSLSKEQLNSQISSLFGGRIAEELIYGSDMVTTGASNDIERATDLARNMVTKWGLSAKLGPLSYSEEEGEVFLGRSVTQHKNVSDETAHIIDEEIRSFIDKNYERSEKILKDNIDKLHTMTDALMKYETIDRDQIDDIMAGKPPREPKGWSDIDSSGPEGGSSVDSEEKKDSDAEKKKDSTDDSIGGTADQH
ncbi:MAG: ATP-dependent zinc metalloprotease FtsH [gamma proteobacterium symbiont of Bathyaustriella thionipta]|nr:ATP-dependent zinc metalloprotease FtsH [gamma proteobacterium symbiont of Bathyaustriella thionipta]MCU7948849.1 ATP-dependent zinc metalloprotease FtsH [gamma proteobacterium symbiont of Bathyaustriella thionipta]MCU7951942.1 ATP-dependent zinc metalloprotease FtsH [gamma proteobacterium symbiont of Bathyaustriella thionipta]MCU7955423.1 ATP-dependent zinc metalloprotease FtsH [gamma proteobacterium symbiont of Bathyaustriella thionipta]MCU7965760.1 ATP-dependent zinc metalloprotease FtsH 